MRITSDIWVHVFIRKENKRGAFATIMNRGATEAGTIFVVENHLDDTYTLYGPAPQSLIIRGDDDRLFEQVCERLGETEIKEYLAKQRKFDPDIWIIETECRQGPPELELADNANEHSPGINSFKV